MFKVFKPIILYIPFTNGLSVDLFLLGLINLLFLILYENCSKGWDVKSFQTINNLHSLHKRVVSWLVSVGFKSSPFLIHYGSCSEEETNKVLKAMIIYIPFTKGLSIFHPWCRRLCRDGCWWSCIDVWVSPQMLMPPQQLTRLPNYPAPFILRTNIPNGRLLRWKLRVVMEAGPEASEVGAMRGLVWGAYQENPFGYDMEKWSPPSRADPSCDNRL